MMYLEVAGGLIVLLFGGEVLVRGAISLAERLDIPKLIIGLTVVALGTSAPELVVSLEAALSGVPAIAVGNVVGSNIANVLLVLGLPAVIYPVACACDGPIRRNAALMVGATILFVTFGWGREYVAWQGVVMLMLLCAFLYISYYHARRFGDSMAVELTEELEGGSPKSLKVAGAFILVGLVALPLGSGLLIDGAVAVAETAGLSEAAIGVTLVALGTSLPELATSVMAAIHRHGDVALGNVVGSNLFNVLGIMGVTAIVTPVPVPIEILHFDFWVLLAVTGLMFAFILRRRDIGRVAGIICFSLYGAYVFAQLHGWSGIDHHAMAGM
jgi:cation:H+ antiporter